MQRTRWQRKLERLPIWLTGVTFSAAVLMIVGLIGLILVKGLGTFWPRELWQVSLKDGRHYLGLVHMAEAIPNQFDEQGKPLQRTLYRIGNRDLYGTDFVWVEDAQVTMRQRPNEATVVERLEWGPFHGFVKEVQTPEKTLSEGIAWTVLQQEIPKAKKRLRAIRHMERRLIGDVNYVLEEHRLAIRKIQLRSDAKNNSSQQSIQDHEKAMVQLNTQYASIADRLEKLRNEDRSYRVIFHSIDGKSKELPISSLVRLHRPNRLTLPAKIGLYADRLREFLFDQPREANSEGGVAPAIFGTVMMTLLMSLAVVPLGVLAALYLHEYAKQGFLVSAVRIAVNNLAGVPSIVFGVFGLGFFCYLIGGTIDRIWFPERLPTPTFGGGAILWAALTLALLTVPVVIVATEEALASVPNGVRAASLACGATKFQTIWHVVLPAAIPGILTGTILAMARGAGEVAPLMITGVVKLAPELPVDHVAPFLHLERKFMHLGFHIYDVGFQSPNVEASKAMVYMTTLLLLGVVVCLNLAAMQIRGRLRSRFGGAEV
ncbi:MAG: phosphate ABC transporter permease PstA [Candidatus Omnitrophica bacterium]|nr:phosphate ABC transporter permease PstA [Candidatus Omnitrophota bacterium]